MCNILKQVLNQNFIVYPKLTIKYTFLLLQISLGLQLFVPDEIYDRLNVLIRFFFFFFNIINEQIVISVRCTNKVFFYSVVMSHENVLK